MRRFFILGVCAGIAIGVAESRARGEGGAALPTGPAVGGLAKKYAPIAERIIAHVRAGNDSYKKMEELCDDIGHRLSGSPELEQAVEWAKKTFEKDGHENVRLQKVMVPKWVRGRESVTMIKPRMADMPMLGLGGSEGTPPEGITAPVIVVKDEVELKALGDKVKGRIVLFNNPMPPFNHETNSSGYGGTVRYRGVGAELVAAQGGVACLVRSVTARSLRTPHTGATRRGDKPRVPAAAVTVEDAELMSRLAARGKEVVVTLKMEAKTFDDVPSANVIAELRGSAAPDEIVVIGGHLDAWDVGTGAHDDGAGCVMSMEALNVLRKMKLTPRRTIRCVLFTNEENGLRGGTKYAEEHADEMKNHVAAIESDSGAFMPLGFSVHCEDKARQERAVEEIKSLLPLFAPLGMRRMTGGHGGADIGPMAPRGVALLGFEPEGSTYFDYHHTPADTLDKVDPKMLTDDVAAMAIMSYILADMPGRLGEAK